MALNVQLLAKPTADDLASGEKAANGLLSILDTFFAAGKKPATTTDAAWTTAKTQAEVLGHATLGWIALSKKDDQTAEKEFTKVLQLSPNASMSTGWPVDSAQVSSWLGTAIAHDAIQDTKPERYPEALFQFARAASLDQAQGGLNPAGRQAIETYFVSAYTRYHGQDAQGLEELRDLAKAQPFPPASFTIKEINQPEQSAAGFSRSKSSNRNRFPMSCRLVEAYDQLPNSFNEYDFLRHHDGQHDFWECHHQSKFADELLVNRQHRPMDPCANAMLSKHQMETPTSSLVIERGGGQNAAL